MCFTRDAAEAGYLVSWNAVTDATPPRMRWFRTRAARDLGRVAVLLLGYLGVSVPIHAWVDGDPRRAFIVAAVFLPLWIYSLWRVASARRAADTDTGSDGATSTPSTDWQTPDTYEHAIGAAIAPQPHVGSWIIATLNRNILAVAATGSQRLDGTNITRHFHSVIYRDGTRIQAFQDLPTGSTPEIRQPWTFAVTAPDETQANAILWDLTQ